VQICGRVCKNAGAWRADSPLFGAVCGKGEFAASPVRFPVLKLIPRRVAMSSPHNNLGSSKRWVESNNHVPGAHENQKAEENSNPPVRFSSSRDERHSRPPPVIETKSDKVKTRPRQNPNSTKNLRVTRAAIQAKVPVQAQAQSGPRDVAAWLLPTLCGKLTAVYYRYQVVGAHGQTGSSGRLRFEG